MIIKESMLIAICFGFCLTSIVLMVLSIAGYCLFSNSFQNYELIISNWRQYPISDIRISQAHGCNDDELVLNNYQFPGTYNGCDCRQSYSLIYFGMYSSSCSYNQTLHGCRQIYPVENRRFWTFSDPSAEQKFILCGTLDKTYNFYQHATQSNECKEGQLKCGTNSDNFICTYNTKCPIVELGYQSENANTKNEYIKLSNTAQLWYNRESNDQMPFVEMRVAEGEGVCLLNHERSITKGRNDYFLMRDKKVDCDRDPRFQLLYKIDEYTFYSINDSIDLPSKLPEFYINQIYKWGLYKRGYVPWKQSCRGDILKQFKDQEPLLYNIHKMQLGIMIISIIHLCIFGLINILQFKFEILSGFSYVGNIVSLGICLILITIQYRKAHSEVQLFRDIVDKQCSDKVTQQTLIILADSLDNDIYRFNYGLFILLIIVIAISISIICITGFNKFMDNKHHQTYDGEYDNDYENRNDLRGSFQNSYADPFHEPIPFYKNNTQNY